MRNEEGGEKGGDINHEEDDDEIEEGDEPRTPHLIEHGSCADGDALHEGKAHEGAGHPHEEESQDGGLQRPAKRCDAPQVPSHIDAQEYDEG